jgi:sulfatase modifying factor 1
MPKSTTFFLAFVSISSFAQKSVSLEKLGLKSFQQKLSYIPSKSFTSHSFTGSDSTSFYGPRVATVPGFYIGKTEVTNKEYREFTQYVKDSMAHTLLSHFKNGANDIDWSQPIDWINNRLEPIWVSQEDRIYGRKEIDAGKLIYEIDFFGTKEIISIYPDTLVWIKDFTYSYNEPLSKRYFSHIFYNDYPVVGVSLKQAMAFCQWKTSQLQQHLTSGYEIKIRLPGSNEWESAAFDIDETRSLFSKNKKYNCNFGQITGNTGFTEKDFKDDGYFYTSPVKNYPAGPFSLYDMKGNVAEWTSTSRDDIVGIEMKPEKEKKSFVVKGGGWNSTPFYLQPGVCQFFPADAAKSFIGFRYVVYVVKKH